MQVQEITCFKAYDVRGRVPDQLNEEIAFRIGRAFAAVAAETGAASVSEQRRSPSQDRRDQFARAHCHSP